MCSRPIILLFNSEILKTGFQQIIGLYEKIKEKKKELEIKLVELQKIYNILIKTNHKRLLIFCIDAFFFKYKMLIHEQKHLQKTEAYIINCVYGDYYKLHEIIIQQLKEKNLEMCLKKTTSTQVHTPYKELEPTFYYEMEQIHHLHKSIILIMEELSCSYLDRSEKHKKEKEKNKLGISMYINTLNYEDKILKEQIILFYNYISFFQYSQKKDLENLLNKMNTLYTEIIEDITTTPYQIKKINNNLQINVCEQQEQEQEQEFTTPREEPEKPYEFNDTTNNNITL